MKKKIKAGMTVEKKLKAMLEMTRNDDFGELTEELEALHNMIINMQKAMLEPLLESVETIERRMLTYVENKNMSTDSLPDVDAADEEGELSKSQAAFKYDPADAVDAREELDVEAKQTTKAEKKVNHQNPPMMFTENLTRLRCRIGSLRDWDTFLNCKVCQTNVLHLSIHKARSLELRSSRTQKESRKKTGHSRLVTASKT